MATKHEIIQALRDHLAMEVTDRDFPLRKEAYKMLGAKPVKATKSKDPVFSMLPSFSEDPKEDGWLPIKTIPRGKKVEILSVTGNIRTVTARPDQKIKNGKLYCWGVKGSATAVNWREIK